MSLYRSRCDEDYRKEYIREYGSSSIPKREPLYLGSYSLSIVYTSRKPRVILKLLLLFGKTKGPMEGVLNECTFIQVCLRILVPKVDRPNPKSILDVLLGSVHCRIRFSHNLSYNLRACKCLVNFTFRKRRAQRGGDNSENEISLTMQTNPSQIDSPNSRMPSTSQFLEHPEPSATCFCSFFLKACFTTLFWLNYCFFNLQIIRSHLINYINQS